MADYHINDKVGDTHTVVPSWTADFAMGQLSREDFKRIDSNKDNVLSKNELNAAVSNKDLTPMSEHAAQVLQSELSNPHVDNRGIFHADFVNNWHDLDPDFKDVSTDSLAKYIAIDYKAAKACNELVKRVDFALTPGEVNDVTRAFAIANEALKTNKDFEQTSDFKPFLTNRPLTDERRRQIHEAIFGDIGLIDAQIKVRTGMASVYDKHGNRPEAQKWLTAAVDRSDVLMKKVKTDKGDIRLIDLMKGEADQLVKDSKGNDEFLHAATRLDEIIRSPIETRQKDARSSLGMSVSGDTYGSERISINTADPLFNPDRAEQLSKESRNLSIDILGIDPARSASARDSSLFGSSWNDIDPKSKYNFYRDANYNGKVDLIEQMRDMKEYNNSWKATAFGRRIELP